MQDLNAFVSVGGTATVEQEAFVRSVEDRLRIEGIVPHTVGRNSFSSDAPLKTVMELLDRCAGTVVIALERSYFPSGCEKRGGPHQTPLSEVRLPTPWNHIEAAMAYSRGHPLMVIVEKGLKTEGLMERGYDWYVQWIEPNPAALTTGEFNGVLASWKKKLVERAINQKAPPSKNRSIEPAELTIGELIAGLKPAQFWSMLSALAALVVGSFVLGAKFFNGA